MDALFQGISNILDGLIPSALLSEFQGLNDILAYAITIGLVYAIILKPILKITGIIKR